MKNTSLYISIAAFVVAVTLGVLALVLPAAKKGAKAETQIDSTTVAAGSIAYIQLDRIIEEYDMANDLKTVVETKVNNIQAEVTRRGKKLENDYKSLQDKMNKHLVTQSTAEVQAQQLQKREQEFNAYAQKKQEEIQEEQIVMMNQIADAIKTFVDKYNEEKQYAMILSNQAGVPVITACEALDITDDVLAGLNAEYVKTKNEKTE